jgi:hypothetical protein
MANLTAKLVRICKTPHGWRGYPAIIGKNGRVRLAMRLTETASNTSL